MKFNIIHKFIILLSYFVFASGAYCVSTNSVDAFLDSYEKSVVQYEELVTNDAYINGDMMAILTHINNASVANLEMTQKYEDLKQVEWSNKQEMRYLLLTNRFSQAMLKLSQAMK